MSQNLQYNYAQIDLETGRCIACFTSSYQIPVEGYVEIPIMTEAFTGSYYNFENGLWYSNAEMTIEATELNEIMANG